jgi:hypothetical protein
MSAVLQPSAARVAAKIQSAPTVAAVVRIARCYLGKSSDRQAIAAIAAARRAVLAGRK